MPAGRYGLVVFRIGEGEEQLFRDLGILLRLIDDPGESFASDIINLARGSEGTVDKVFGAIDLVDRTSREPKCLSLQPGAASFDPSLADLLETLRLRIGDEKLQFALEQPSSGKSIDVVGVDELGVIGDS